MNIEELKQEIAHKEEVKVITDPTRLLPPAPRLTITYPRRRVVAYEEGSGLVHPFYLQLDGHLGAVEEF